MKDGMSLAKLAEEEVRERLLPLGFERRGRYGILVRECADDIYWLIGLNRVVPPPYDRVALNPVIGAEHRGVQLKDAQLSGLTFEPYIMTISRTLSVLSDHPGAWWTDGSAEELSALGVDVARAVEQRGLPFLERNAESLDSMISAMEGWIGVPPDLRRRLVIALRLRGDDARAKHFVEEFSAELGATAEGRQYERFAASFRSDVSSWVADDATASSRGVEP